MWYPHGTDTSAITSISRGQQVGVPVSRIPDAVFSLLIQLCIRVHVSLTRSRANSVVLRAYVMWQLIGSYSS